MEVAWVSLEKYFALNASVERVFEIRVSDLPELVYSVAREATEDWATVKQADKLRSIQSRAKDAVAQGSSAKEDRGRVLALVI